MALWTPAEIATALWLDAADSSTLFDSVSGGSLVSADGAVARWEDKSGNANHAVQSDSNFRPLRKVSQFNLLDSVLFDGSNDKMQGSATPMTTAEKMLVCVFKRTGSGGEILQNGITGSVAQPSTLFRANGNTAIAGDVTTTNVTISTNLSVQWTQLGVSSWVQQSNRTFLYWHNATGYSTTGTVVSPNPSAGYRLGVPANGDNFFTHFSGSICELVAVSGTTLAQTRNLIEGYLAWKWGLQGNLPADHPYKNAAPIKSGGLAIIVASHHAALGI